MAKKSGSYFIFSNKSIIHNNSYNYLFLNYKINDCNYFLSFLTETKEFEKYFGFGRNDQEYRPYWWKSIDWREI